MGIGLEVFMPNGLSQFDTSTRIARGLYSFSTGTSDGSVVVPNVVGDKFPMITRATLGRATPSITISGNTVSWSFGSIPAIARADCDVLVMTR